MALLLQICRQRGRCSVIVCLLVANRLSRVLHSTKNAVTFRGRVQFTPLAEFGLAVVDKLISENRLYAALEDERLRSRQLQNLPRRDQRAPRLLFRNAASAAVPAPVALDDSRVSGQLREEFSGFDI